MTLLQAQFDKLKRKALFAPAMGNENIPGLVANVLSNSVHEDQRPRAKVHPVNSSVPVTRDTPTAGGMEANRVGETNAIGTFSLTN